MQSQKIYATYFLNICLIPSLFSIKLRQIIIWFLLYQIKPFWQLSLFDPLQPKSHVWQPCLQLSLQWHMHTWVEFGKIRHWPEMEWKLKITQLIFFYILNIFINGIHSYMYMCIKNLLYFRAIKMPYFFCAKINNHSHLFRSSPFDRIF